MKKCLIVLTLAISSLFISCASSKTEENKAQIEEPKIDVPLFDDWKYKGFGYDLPQSVDKVVEIIEENNIQIHAVKIEEDFIIACGTGINSDQALKKAKDSLDEIIQKEESQDFNDLELAEETWVRLNAEYFELVLNSPDSPLLDTPYIAYKIYQKTKN